MWNSTLGFDSNCVRAGLPDPFAKVVVDGSGQCHSTDTVKSTLDPKWNQHYDLWVSLQLTQLSLFKDFIQMYIQWMNKKVEFYKNSSFALWKQLLLFAVTLLVDIETVHLDISL